MICFICVYIYTQYNIYIYIVYNIYIYIMVASVCHKLLEKYYFKQDVMMFAIVKRHRMAWNG
jgi:hypothetical protein